MLQTLTRLICALLFAAALFVPTLAQEISIEEAAALLPDRLGDFRAQGPANRGEFGLRVNAEDFSIRSHARRFYVSASGEAFWVLLAKTNTDTGAYSLLTHLADPHPSSAIKTGEVGAASVTRPGGISFFKGPAFVAVDGVPKSADGDAPPLLDFARLIAERLDAGEGGIPALALHLPEWERVRGQLDYVVSLPVLKALVDNQPILDVLSFEGGTEAVTALYGGSRLIIIEFTTPQYSVENDARITQRIAELRESGQPMPSAYRREGNYSVFVFDAPDEAAANTLIEQVKYEKDVRWLGDNPHVAEQVERAYRMTMTGIIVTTLKATGLAILICLGVGGIFGGAVFLYRRARPTANKAYTDAGGVLRLDIEDANTPRDSSELLGKAGER